MYISMTASDELRLGGDHNRQINYRKKKNNNKTKQKIDNLWTDIEHIQKTKRSIMDNKLAKLDGLPRSLSRRVEVSKVYLCLSVYFTHPSCSFSLA